MIEDEYSNEVVAIGWANAAFNGCQFGGFPDLIKRHYLDQAKFVHDALKQTASASNVNEVADQVVTMAHLLGRL
ncbi:hypothetical protein AB9E15_11605 [Rhizobium leguminosarum]|jgi:hypothetical protein|uniref:hypothetical protein n=1 Tax=Rhizobium leguminosarum TaxID=384 RepID=UPI003F9890C9